jgi:hypothetical protein
MILLYKKISKYIFLTISIEYDDIYEHVFYHKKYTRTFHHNGSQGYNLVLDLEIVSKRFRKISSVSEFMQEMRT